MLSSSVSLPHHTSLAIDGSYSTCFRSIKVRNIKEKKKEHGLAVLLISKPIFVTLYLPLRKHLELYTTVQHQRYISSSSF